jgi:predicted amidophosphoribosyltransferase
MQPIAKELAARLDLECANIFDRPKSADQRKLGRNERAKNTSGTFRIINSKALEKDIILVDDISTTGATLLSAANCIAQKRALLGLKTKSFGLTFGKVLE